jgi:hypothetical protein
VTLAFAPTLSHDALKSPATFSYLDAGKVLSSSCRAVATVSEFRTLRAAERSRERERERDM